MKKTLILVVAMVACSAASALIAIGITSARQDKLAREFDGEYKPNAHWWCNDVGLCVRSREKCETFGVFDGRRSRCTLRRIAFCVVNSHDLSGCATTLETCRDAAKIDRITNSATDPENHCLGVE